MSSKTQKQEMRWLSNNGMNGKRDNYLQSVSRVYADALENKNPQWYDAKNFEPQWSPPGEYYIMEKVGRGKYSTVFKAKHKKTTLCAIKTLVPLDPKRYNLEIKILSNLSGEKNIVKLLDLNRDPVTGVYSLIFEWIEFGSYRELYATFNLSDVKIYMYKLLLALDTAHKNGIMHRDVKPQNIAIDKSKRRLRLLDWGLADFYKPGQKYSSHVATRIFKPPELFLKYPYYDYSIDIWCAGLTMSIMLFKKLAIESADDDEKQLLKLADLIGGREIVKYADEIGCSLSDADRQTLLSKQGKKWDSYVEDVGPEMCPPEAVDLLNRMLTVDHRKRITAREALVHPFFDSLKARHDSRLSR